MKTNLKDLPVLMQEGEATLRNQSGFGGMTIAYNELPAGTDFRPLLEGLMHDSCHCPHWGYVFEGSIRLFYDDGTEEVVGPNQAFYLPNGHTGIVEKDIKFVEFSPTEQFSEVMTHIGKRMAEMQA